MRARCEPLRSCVACRRKGSKDEFVRVVRYEGAAAIDESGKLGGRGAYICLKRECLKAAIKKKAFGRALRLTNGAGASLENVYAGLWSRIEEGDKHNP